MRNNTITLKHAIWIFSILSTTIIITNLSNCNQPKTSKLPYPEPSTTIDISTPPAVDITPVPPPVFDTVPDIPIPLPRSGKVTRSTNKRAIAPLAIESATGSNYFLKLIDISSQTTAMTVFIHGGSPVRVKVPIGSYEIRYAAGNTWYGTQKLFGAETRYSKAKTIFNFKREGNRVMGYTLKLYEVTNGNLPTDPIDPSQF